VLPLSLFLSLSLFRFRQNCDFVTGSLRLNATCYEAATQSAAKPTLHREEKEQVEGGDEQKQRRGNSEAACIQSKRACFEAAIQSETKPTSHQEEKEQAEERDKQKERRGSNEAVRVCIQSKKAYYAVAIPLSGREGASKRKRER
jgi:hypothetical protein